MDRHGKRTPDDKNEEVVITITAPENAIQQHYEWLRLQPRGCGSSCTSTKSVLVQVMQIRVRAPTH